MRFKIDLANVQVLFKNSRLSPANNGGVLTRVVAAAEWAGGRAISYGVNVCCPFFVPELAITSEGGESHHTVSQRMLVHFFLFFSDHRCGCKAKEDIHNVFHSYLAV